MGCLGEPKIDRSWLIHFPALHCYLSLSPKPGRVLGPDLVSEGGGDGEVALLGDGQAQEHAGGDGHVTHNVAPREQHPTNKYFGTK